MDFLLPLILVRIFSEISFTFEKKIHRALEFLKKNFSLDMTSNIKHIESPTHPLEITVISPNQSKGQVKQAPLGKNFTVTATVEDPYKLKF